MALYVITVSSSISVVGTGLFMMVCEANGIAHPLGYPLATLICHPMMSLPFYDVDRETCEYLVTHQLTGLLSQVGCAN